jgi:FMN phosphatase YigB (HAD superfamily)
MNIIQYGFHLKISPFNLSKQIKLTFFDILDKTALFYNLDTLNPLDQAYDEKGRALPYLMRAWLQGTMTCHEIRKLLNNAIELHPEWFTHQSEQRIAENLIKMVFTPQHFVATRKICSEGIDFIKKCKRQGHSVYALSNWDAESFELLKKQYPELFDLFDGIMISGDNHMLKPHVSFYQSLLDRYNLEPHRCWFIDDQEENVRTAQQLGINGIVHPLCFRKLARTIKAHSKSLIRRENLKNTGISVSKTKNTNSPIIDGENISRTDSTK